MSLSRKHYFKLADFFGTFEHHLKDTGVWLDNDGEDINQEFDNLIDNVVNFCLEDNRLFKPQTFRDEIKNVRSKKQKEYNNN